MKQLYSLMSTYQLLNALIMRSFNPEGEATIVLYPSAEQKIPNIEALSFFFSRVLFLDEGYRFLHTLEETRRFYCANLGSMDEYDDIFVWAAQYSMGVFLAEEGIEFSYGEDAAGLVSRPYVLEKDVQRLNPDNYSHIKQLGLFDGTGESIKKVICDLSAQTTEYQNERVLDINVLNRLGSLEEQKRQKIISVFFPSGGCISVRNNSYILLTEHLANLLALSFEEQALLYQTFVDYFFEDENLIIKPHPDDILYYDMLFPKAQILRDIFPAELMPFVFDHKPKGLATVSSTVAMSLKDRFDHTIEMGTDFRKCCRYMHRYHYAAEILERAGLGMCARNCINSIIKNYVFKRYSFNNRVEKQALIVDDFSNGENCEDRKDTKSIVEGYRCVVFLNSLDRYIWHNYWDKSAWSRVIPIVIKKKTILEGRVDTYASLQPEIIYVYAQDDVLREQIRSMEIEKQLEATNIEMYMEHLTPEQEKIKVLEGMLAATEKKLQYYIDKEEKRKV